MVDLAPVVLFVYNRPEHTEKTLISLMYNKLSEESVLYIYHDGVKAHANEIDLKRFDEVKKVIRKKRWCKSVSIIESEVNKGLADSITSGVTEIVNKHGKVIVLEDDIVTSPGFLKYVNDALFFHKDNKEVMGISGFMFPISKNNLPETFLYPANSCWGWGTWKDRWANYNDDAEQLYSELIKKPVDWKCFNAYQNRSFEEQLIANVQKKKKTWAIKWHACVHLHDGSILHPRQTLTKNIGLDGSGENCGFNNAYDDNVLAREIRVTRHSSLKSDALVESALKNYFNKKKTGILPFRKFLMKCLHKN